MILHSSLDWIKPSLEANKQMLDWLGFKVTATCPHYLDLSNAWHRITVTYGAINLYKGDTFMRSAETLSAIMTTLLNTVHQGKWYTYVAGVPVVPKQQFGLTESQVKALAYELMDNNATLLYKAEKVIRWSYPGKEIEVTNSNIKITQKETTMDIFDLAASASLFTVKVQFPGSNNAYSYKSEVAYEPDTKVLVDSPNSGLTVVTVIESSEGLSPGNFPKFKWIVCPVDLTRYYELLANEKQAIDKLKAAKQMATLKQELEALGTTQAEFLQMLGLASKDK